MLKSESIGKISAALLKAQGEMGAAVKDSKNPFFKSKYADINSVREACHPALNANGITVLQPMSNVSNNDGTNSSFVETILVHESGEYIGSQTPIICSKPNDPQALGSAISYARRYSLQSLVSLGTADDDAEAGMSREAKPAATFSAPTKSVASDLPIKKSSFKQTATPLTKHVTTADVAQAVSDQGGWDD